MKTLVTGANGFIGATIVRELVKDGEDVRVLVRKNSDIRSIDDLKVEKAYGDIRDSESMNSALKDCDTLYHVAALFAHWVPDKKLIYDVNVEGTKVTLQAALQQKVKKVVYTSSNVSIGSHGKDSLVTEDAEFNGWDLGDHYTLSKYYGELEAKKFVEKGLPIVIVNPTMVVGARDLKPTPSGEMIIDIANRATPGYIDGGTNVIDVEDVARGHILAAKKGRIGERYLFGNVNISVRDYFNLIAEVAGVEPPKYKIPYPVAIFTGYLFEFISSITKKMPVTTASVVRIGSRYESYNCSKAINELGLPQTPIKVAVEKAYKWFKDNGYIK